MNGVDMQIALDLLQQSVNPPYTLRFEALYGSSVMGLPIDTIQMVTLLFKMRHIDIGLDINVNPATVSSL